MARKVLHKHIPVSVANRRGKHLKVIETLKSPSSAVNSTATSSATQSTRKNQLKLTINLKKLSEEGVSDSSLLKSFTTPIKKSTPSAGKVMITKTPCSQLQLLGQPRVCTRSMARAQLVGKKPKCPTETSRGTKVTLKLKLNPQPSEYCDAEKVQSISSPCSTKTRSKQKSPYEFAGWTSSRAVGNKSLAMKLSKCLLTKLSYSEEDEVVEMVEEKDELQSAMHSPPPPTACESMKKSTSSSLTRKGRRKAQLFRGDDQLSLGKPPPSSASGKSPSQYLCSTHKHCTLFLFPPLLAPFPRA